MPGFTFSALGCRWRVQRIVDEPLPAGRPHGAATGLYFSSDDADPRFLAVEPTLLPTDADLAMIPLERLSALLNSAPPLEASA